MVEEAEVEACVEVEEVVTAVEAGAEDEEDLLVVLWVVPVVMVTGTVLTLAVGTTTSPGDSSVTDATHHAKEETWDRLDWDQVLTCVEETEEVVAVEWAVEGAVTEAGQVLCAVGTDETGIGPTRRTSSLFFKIICLLFWKKEEELSKRRHISNQYTG